MSTWQYAFLFPRSNMPLMSKEAVQELEERGLEFDDELFPLQLYPDGHVEVAEQAIEIAKPADVDLCERLSRNEQIEVLCRNKEIFVVCSFATAASNPYISLGWSVRLFTMLSEEAKEAYRRMIRRVAVAVGAFHVVFVEEPPDYFEDHFVDVDGVRCLDVFLPSGSRHSVFEIWSKGADSIDSEGVQLVPEGTLEDGFRTFSVVEV